MTDKYGYVFEDLVQIQETDLRRWQDKLKPEIHAAVAEYARKHNAPSSEHHHVYRGQDLVVIILQWPELRPPYPPRLDPIDEV